MDILLKVLTLLSEPWVLMVLVASVLFAAGNYIDELLLDRFNQPVGVLIVISGFFSLVLTIFFGVLAVVWGETIRIEAHLRQLAVLVGVLEMLWVIPYLFAVKRRGAIVAGPLFQAVPVVALVLEAMYGIVPPAIQIAGGLLIVLGGVILSVEKHEDENGLTTHRIDWMTIGLMLLSVLLVAVIYVLFKDASLQSSYIAVGFWSGIGMLAAASVIYILWPQAQHEFDVFCRQADRKAVGLQALNELFDAGGAYLTHLANVVGPSVMLVTAFNATQPIVIGLMGMGLAQFGFIAKRGHLNKAAVFITLMALTAMALGTVLMALGMSE